MRKRILSLAGRAGRIGALLEMRNWRVLWKEPEPLTRISILVMIISNIMTKGLEYPKEIATKSL